MRLLEWAPIHSDWCSYKKRRFGHRDTRHVGTEESPCENTVRRLCAQGEVLTETNLAETTLILDFQLQICEKINFCCLSHPGCGVLLWQTEQTNTISDIKEVIHRYLSNVPFLLGRNDWYMVLGQTGLHEAHRRAAAVRGCPGGEGG